MSPHQETAHASGYQNSGHVPNVQRRTDNIYPVPAESAPTKPSKQPEAKTQAELSMKQEKGPGKHEATNDTVAAKHRKKRLVAKHSGPSKIKYYVWLAGHTMSLLFGLVSFTWQVLWLRNVYYVNSIAYRMSLLGAVMALGASMSKKFGLRYLPPFSTLLAQRNFQYLVLSLVWSFTFKSIFKLIPTLMISFLQLALHFKAKAVLGQADLLASAIAFDEILLVLYLLVRTLLFRYTAGYQLLIMLTFLWLRVLFDESTANMFGYLVIKLDGRVSGVKNEKVQKVWKKIKVFLKEKQHPGMTFDEEYDFQE